MSEPSSELDARARVDGAASTGAHVPLIERYRERLPFAPGDPVVTLGEGSTPLLRAPVLSERVGAEVHLKLEGANPTGSFKDRGMTCAVSAAVREGAKAVICASTGNTAASAAAYAAKAGHHVRGDRPGRQDRDRQARPDADPRRARDRAARQLRQGARARPRARPTRTRSRSSTRSTSSASKARRPRPSSSLEDLDGRLDALCIPVGNAGNITAYWRGFVEAGAAPRLFGFQAEGAAPLVLGHAVEHPETVASAIRIGNPARWEEAMAAATESRGAIRAVSDEEILAAYRLLAAKEGIFCEPASAASVAGLLKYGADGAERVVCVLTGRGLKDPETALEQQTAA